MDMAAIRARLAGLANKTNKRRDVWKPKDKHTIRCLPYPHGDEPVIELGFHYELGATRSLLCPKHNFGEECAVCDFADKLKSWNDENGNEKPEDLRKADFEIFKKIQVRERWYVPMIDRADEEPTPKFYAFGKTIFETILNMCLNEEMHEIAGTEGTDVLTSPDNAFDLTVDFKQAENKDGKGNTKSFPVTSLTQKMRPSKLTDTKKSSQELVNKVPNIFDAFPKVTSAEAERVFMDFVNQGGGEAKVDDSGVEYKSHSAEAPVKGGQSIDEAFEELAG